LAGNEIRDKFREPKYDPFLKPWIIPARNKFCQMRFKQLAVLLCALLIQQGTVAQRDFSDSGVTKLVLLGTGNPNPSPDQSGCALAIVVNDVPYVVDFGPGLIRRAAALSPPLRWQY